jgi:hypothetical protein
MDRTGRRPRTHRCLSPTARELARGSADKDEDGRRELTVATEFHWRDTDSDPDPEPNGPDRPETTHTRVPVPKGPGAPTGQRNEAQGCGVHAATLGWASIH